MNRAEIGGRKLELTYPCAWSYKAIGTEAESVVAAIESVVGKRECLIHESNRSRSGKYVSVALETVVSSEEDRTTLYEALLRAPAIKMVL